MYVSGQFHALRDRLLRSIDPLRSTTNREGKERGIIAPTRCDFGPTRLFVAQANII
jgi:hypothetical protein